MNQKFLSTLGLDGDRAVTKPFDGGQDVVDGFGPAKAPGVGIADVYVGSESGLQHRSRAVGDAFDLLVGEQCEEVLGGNHPARMMMIAAGTRTATTPRRDPMFKLALDRLPLDEELRPQSTISWLENLPDARALLLRLGRALVGQYCASFRQVPKRIVLDIDDTFDRVLGGQHLRLFNAFHDD